VADLLERGHYSTRLHGVAARANIEINVRAWQAQLLEQQAVHTIVVMLASMDKELREQIRMFGECGDDGRHLYQIGPRADDVDNLMSACRPRELPLLSKDVDKPICA